MKPRALLALLAFGALGIPAADAAAWNYTALSRARNGASEIEAFLERGRT